MKIFLFIAAAIAVVYAAPFDKEADSHGMEASKFERSFSNLHRPKRDGDDEDKDKDKDDEGLGWGICTENLFSTLRVKDEASIPAALSRAIQCVRTQLVGMAAEIQKVPILVNKDESTVTPEDLILHISTIQMSAQKLIALMRFMKLLRTMQKPPPQGGADPAKRERMPLIALLDSINMNRRDNMEYIDDKDAARIMGAHERSDNMMTQRDSTDDMTANMDSPDFIDDMQAARIIRILRGRA